MEGLQLLTQSLHVLVQGGPELFRERNRSLIVLTSKQARA